MKDLDMNELLRKSLVSQGCVDPEAVRFEGWSPNLSVKNETAMAVTKYRRQGGRRMAVILLHEGMKRCSSSSNKCVMWHEAAHATEWVNEGTTGHGVRWMHYCVKNPLYFFIGHFTATFDFIIHNLRP